MNVNCNNCIFISITELEQHRNKILKPHLCLKHHKRLFHRDNHRGLNNLIYPCCECDGKDFIKRK